MVVLLSGLAVYLGFYVSEGSLDLPRYKLYPAEVERAEEIADLAPKGPMLSGGGLELVIPMVRSGLPQVTIRLDAMAIWLGQGQEQRLRMMASWFVAEAGFVHRAEGEFDVVFWMEATGGHEPR